MTEFDFIRQYLRRQQSDGLILGIGDDAAIVRPRTGFDLCFSSDMLLKGRHFFPDVAPEDLAHKILAVNISDMAAMGAQPRWVLFSAGLPELDQNWLRRFCDSFFAMAQRFDTVLIGGDTTKGDLVFNITIVGELPQGRALRRDAAQAGDDIWVSGQIGLAAAALNHRLGRDTLPESVLPECLRALNRPEPRVALGQALLPLANAAQDISDGLAQDLGHILAASSLGATLRADLVPTLPALKTALSKTRLYACTLAGGDDYELVFTAAPDKREAIRSAAAQCGTPVTRIGQTDTSGRLNITDADGSTWQADTLGFDHFG